MFDEFPRVYRNRDKEIKYQTVNLNAHQIFTAGFNYPLFRKHIHFTKKLYLFKINTKQIDLFSFFIVCV